MHQEFAGPEPAVAFSKRHRLDFGVATEQLQSGTCLVAVVGYLDSRTAPELARALDRVLADEPGDMVVDLSACAFVDSTCLGILVGTGKRLIGSGGSLALVSSDRNLLRLLELTCLSVVFKVHPTRAHALAGTYA